MTKGRRHVCSRDGHVLVRGDGNVCLVCDRMVQSAERVGLQVVRTQPPEEMRDPRDVASKGEWGPVG